MGAPYYLEQKKFCLQLIEEVDIYDVDEVVQDISEAGADEEHLPAVLVRPGSGKEGVHHGREGLEHAIVRLQSRDVLLHPNLLSCVVLDVVADFHVESEVNLANLVDDYDDEAYSSSADRKYSEQGYPM